MTHGNLGNALLLLGERENGVERLRQAVDHYRFALYGRTRAHVPRAWALTLSAAHRAAGEKDLYILLPRFAEGYDGVHQVLALAHFIFRPVPAP